MQENLDPDFLDRISTLRLKLPSLREIPEDMPWLWQKVWEVAKTRSGVFIHSKLEKKLEHSKIIKTLQQLYLPGNIRDLFQIAYRLIAVMNDQEIPISPDDAIQYALQNLNYQCLWRTPSELLKQVANAIANNNSLAPLITKKAKFPSKLVQKEFQNYLAKEIRRIAKSNQIPVKELCDVTERTLLNWEKS